MKIIDDSMMTWSLYRIYNCGRTMATIYKKTNGDDSEKIIILKTISSNRFNEKSVDLKVEATVLF